MIIYEQCKEQFACIRYCLSFLLSITVAIIAIYGCYKLFKKNQRKFELIPLITCCLQAILHCIQYSVINDNELKILTNFITLITYGFVGHSLSALYIRLKHQNQSHVIKYTFLSLISEIIVYGSIFGLQIYILIEVQPKHCERMVFISLLIMQIQFLLSSLFITVFGILLLRTINQNKVTDAEINLLESQDFMRKSKCSQIKTVIYTVNMAMILQVTLIVGIYVGDRKLLCFDIEEEDKQRWFNIPLFLLTIVQQIPCIIIPYVFHYSENNNHNNVNIDVIGESEDQTTEEENEENNEDLFVKMLKP